MGSWKKKWASPGFMVVTLQPWGFAQPGPDCRPLTPSSVLLSKSGRCQLKGLEGLTEGVGPQNSRVPPLGPAFPIGALLAGQLPGAAPPHPCRPRGSGSELPSASSQPRTLRCPGALRPEGDPTGILDALGQVLDGLRSGVLETDGRAL